MPQIKSINYQYVHKVTFRSKLIFPDSVHIASLKLDRASDYEVWSYAKENDYIIVTKDSDFNDLCTLYDFPPHINSSYYFS
jgi:predicted nuclease of predicted toxin-antitoxin system